MKIRKHKNNKSFLITFTHHIPVHTKIETHADERGKSRKVSVVTDRIVSPVSRVWATGSCRQSVMRAFLFGRDASNIRTTIREVSPPLWGGRFVVSEFNGVPTTLCPV